VRDPFGEHDSFGAHNNARLRAFLDGFGFDYEFHSAAACYRAGRFDEVLLRFLERFDEVQRIMLPTLGPSVAPPIRPSCPSARRPAGCCRSPRWSGTRTGTIVFDDEDGRASRRRSPAGA
jgi:lysyl-tRNA synthetase class 1